jgi:tRNA dimethylallyltransferase
VAADYDMKRPKLLVIVGETASGKSALALHLAQRFNGEILCADSRTIYKGMDIGTAKPSAQDQALVQHHLIDLVSPSESFSAADFKQRADGVITALQGQGKLPILVGGTGLYIDAVIYNYQFRDLPDPIIRAELQTLTVSELQDRIKQAGLRLPENNYNARHLIRTIETNGIKHESAELRSDAIVLGISIDRKILKQRITKRIDSMTNEGFIDEVRRLSATYGWDLPAMATPGYRAFHEYLNDNKSLDSAKAQFATYDMQLAKRQRTWFKRNKSIQWFPAPVDLAQVVEYITTGLNK